MKEDIEKEILTTIYEYANPMSTLEAGDMEIRVKNLLVLLEKRVAEEIFSETDKVVIFAREQYGDTDEIIAYKELRAKYITEEPRKEGAMKDR